MRTCHIACNVLRHKDTVALTADFASSLLTKLQIIVLSASECGQGLLARSLSIPQILAVSALMSAKRSGPLLTLSIYSGSSFMAVCLYCDRPFNRWVLSFEVLVKLGQAVQLW